LTRLEGLAKDKHSSLLRTLVNYEPKRIATLGPGRKFAKLLANFSPSIPWLGYVNMDETAMI
jgi:hypothetical protein